MVYRKMKVSSFVDNENLNNIAKSDLIHNVIMKLEEKYKWFSIKVRIGETIEDKYEKIIDKLNNLRYENWEHSDDYELRIYSYKDDDGIPEPPPIPLEYTMKLKERIKDRPYIKKYFMNVDFNANWCVPAPYRNFIFSSQRRIHKNINEKDFYFKLIKTVKECNKKMLREFKQIKINHGFDLLNPSDRERYLDYIDSKAKEIDNDR